jgi:uncharacterized protein YdaU (DUF1376 family)
MPRVKKAPAYQWYPRDYMADPVVQAMNLEQEGAYRRLMDICWLEQGLPTDVEDLWPLSKASSRDRFLEHIWPVVGRKFQLRRGKYQHKRLDRERAKQAKNRRKRQLAAQTRWNKVRSKRDAHASGVHSLSSSSSTAFTTAVRTSARGKVFVGSRLSVSQKQHNCVVDSLGAEAGYIDWMALYPKWDAQLLASGEPFDTLAFIRQRAQEHVRALRSGGSLFAATEANDVDWFEECQRLHGGLCGGRLKHHTKMLIEEEKAKVAAS